MLTDTADPGAATSVPLITDSITKTSKFDGLLASAIMDDVPVNVKASAVIHMLFSRRLA